MNVSLGIHLLQICQLCRFLFKLKLFHVRSKQDPQLFQNIFYNLLAHFECQKQRMHQETPDACMKV
jgi:hypothetical protein